MAISTASVSNTSSRRSSAPTPTQKPHLDNPPNMSPREQNPPSDEPAPKRPKRTLKLTASQRERKRAIDREAQRSIRLKTKNYIAHLENLVRIMENGGSTVNGAEGAAPQPHGQTREQDDERARALLSQLRQSEEEVQKLKEMVFGVQKLVGTTVSSGEEPPAKWLPYPNGTAAEQSLQTPSSLHDRALDHLDNCASVYSHSSGSSSPMGEFGYQAIDQSRSADPYTSGYVPSSLAQDPYNSFGRLRPRSEAPTSDPNDSSRIKEEGELFFLSDREVNRVLAGGHQSFTNQPLDEDIVVRAVLHGWREVQDQYLLDPGWQALRNIDQSIFRESGIVERMAILWMMRLKLLHQSNSNPQYLAPLPPFFQRSALEDADVLKKSPVIEHFIWPGMRIWLCKNVKKRVSNKFCESFRQSFKFIWPYEVSDAFTRDPSTQLYSLTAGFKQRQWDLRSWTMRKDFFAVASDLINAIPVYDPPTIDRGMVAGSFSAGPSESNTGQMCQQKIHPQIVVPKIEEQEMDQSQLGMGQGKGHGHAHSSGPGPPSVSAHTPTTVPSQGSVPQTHIPYSAEVEAWLGDPELVPPYWNLAPGMHVGYEATSPQWTRVQGGFVG